MIFDLMEAIDVLVTAIAIWIAAGVAALMLTAAGVVWAAVALWRWIRRLATRRRHHATQAPTGAPDSPSRDSDATDTTPEAAERRTAPRWKEAA